jgi:hypothetical protein
VSTFAYQFHDWFVRKIFVVGYTSQMFSWSMWWPFHDSPTGPTCVPNDDCPNTTHTSCGKAATSLDLIQGEKSLWFVWLLSRLPAFGGKRDKLLIFITVDIIIALFIIQKWQKFVSFVGKSFESDLLRCGNKVDFWYRHDIFLVIPYFGKKNYLY